MSIVDRLNESAGEPIPPGARVGIFAAADGLRLRWAAFDVARPKGTVLLLQGRGEYIERYYDTVRDLQARGFTVVTFDWRGQGGSQRLTRHPRKGHASSLAAYDLDLDAFLRLIVPTCPRPWYVLAHSTGALTAIANAARLAPLVRRAVLIAPFLGLGRFGVPERLARGLARALRGVGMGRDWVPGGGATAIHTTPFARNRLTSDPDRHARGAEMSWRHPEVAVGSPTIGWLAAAFDAIDRVLRPEALTAYRLPTLIFVCGDDRVVSNRAIERFATRTVSTDLLVIPGARHELLQERERYREQFWAGFDAFVPGSGAPPVEWPAAVVATPEPVTAAPIVEPPVEPEVAPPAPPPEPDHALTAPAELAAGVAAIAAVAQEIAAVTTPQIPAAETQAVPATEARTVADPDQPIILPDLTDHAHADPDRPIALPDLSDQPLDAPIAPAQVDPAPTIAPDAEALAAAPSPASGDSRELAQHDLVQPGVAAGDDAAAVDRAAAVPTGDDAAGTLDHRDQRDDVVGLQPGLDHHVDEAGGDHAVGVAIDPVARQPDP